MLIPQFTIRWMLGLMTVCAGIFTIFGLAVRGHAWAVGISVAVGALVAFSLVQAALFAVLWLASLAMPPEASEAAVVLTESDWETNPSTTTDEGGA